MITKQDEINHYKIQLKSYRYYIAKREAIIQTGEAAESLLHYSLEDVERWITEMNQKINGIKSDRDRTMITDVYIKGNDIADLYKMYGYRNKQTMYERIDHTIAKYFISKASKRCRNNKR